MFFFVGTGLRAVREFLLPRDTARDTPGRAGHPGLRHGDHAWRCHRRFCARIDLTRGTQPDRWVRVFAPGLLAAVVLHAVYNTLLVTAGLRVARDPDAAATAHLFHVRGTARSSCGTGSNRTWIPTCNCSSRSIPASSATRTQDSTCIRCATSSAARSSRTCSVTCACTSSWRCVPRAC